MSCIITEILILYVVFGERPPNSNSSSLVAMRSFGGARICSSHVEGSLFLKHNELILHYVSSRLVVFDIVLSCQKSFIDHFE